MNILKVNLKDGLHLDEHIENESKIWTTLRKKVPTRRGGGLNRCC